MSLEYRLLQPHESEQFRETYRKAFNLDPDLESMYPMVAWREGEIVGFFCLYNVLVADSMWVAQDLRNTGIWKKLIEAINKLPWPKGRGYYFIQEVDKSKHEVICKKMGGLKLPVNLWRKLF